MDGCMDTSTYIWMYEHKDGCMMASWLDDWMDEHTDGCMMDRYLDG